MKQRITSSFQQLAADRYLMTLIIVFLVACLGLLIFLSTAIHPGDRQVAVHFTSFGTTNFYRDKWYYLLGFAGFVVVMAIVQTILSYKIFEKKGRELAIPFVWLGILLVAIAAALFYQILKVAAIT